MNNIIKKNNCSHLSTSSLLLLKMYLLTNTDIWNTSSLGLNVWSSVNILYLTRREVVNNKTKPLYNLYRVKNYFTLFYVS